MRIISVLPKSVLMLGIIEIVLLSLALLLLNDYLILPTPLNSPLAYVVMMFLGILLISPAAVALIWRVVRLLAPQLMSRAPGDSTDSDRDKRDDSNHWSTPQPPFYPPFC